MNLTATQGFGSRSFKAIVIILGQGLSSLISFIFFPYLARSLSVDDYGTYGQAMLITDTAKAFFILGLTNIIFIQFSDKKLNAADVFKSNFLFSFFSGAVATVLIFLFAAPLGRLLDNTTATHFIKIISISLILQIPVEFIGSVLIYFNKVKTSIAIVLTTNILRVCLLLLSIQVFHSMDLLFYSLSFVALVQLCLFLILLPKELLRNGQAKISIMRSQLLMSLPLVLSGIMGYLLKFIDGFIVSSLLSVRKFAFFRNGAFEIPIISIVFSSISSIVLPELSKLNVDDNKHAMIDLKKKASGAIAIFMVPATVFVLFFSRPIIRLLFGQAYEDTGTASVFFITNLLVLMRINDYQDILIIRSATRYIFIYNIICLLLNIVLSYFLILFFDIEGAAIATTASIYLFAFLLLHKSTQLMNTGIMGFFDGKTLLPVYGISIFISLLLYLCYTMFDNLILVAPFGILHLILTYFIFYKMGLLENPVTTSIRSKLKFGNG
jgi:O-antigen/teichoic acid export membrane protein